jgi:hypothetical protein
MSRAFPQFNPKFPLDPRLADNQNHHPVKREKLNLHRKEDRAKLAQMVARADKPRDTTPRQPEHNPPAAVSEDRSSWALRPSLIRVTAQLDYRSGRGPAVELNSRGCEIWHRPIPSVNKHFIHRWAEIYVRAWREMEKRP